MYRRATRRPRPRRRARPRAKAVTPPSCRRVSRSASCASASTSSWWRGASPGEILVGGGVYRSAKSDWSFEDRPEIDVPDDNETSPGGATLLDEDGEGHSVRRAKAYRLRGHKDRMERLRDSGALGTQLVGRELELRALRDLYRQTVMSRRAHNALVVGEAGVGKRTPVAEFLRGS